MTDINTELTKFFDNVTSLIANLDAASRSPHADAIGVAASLNATISTTKTLTAALASFQNAQNACTTSLCDLAALHERFRAQAELFKDAGESFH